jgi:hypothetical protein
VSCLVYVVNDLIKEKIEAILERCGSFHMGHLRLIYHENRERKTYGFTNNRGKCLGL